MLKILIMEMLSFVIGYNKDIFISRSYWEALHKGIGFGKVLGDKEVIQGLETPLRPNLLTNLWTNLWTLWNRNVWTLTSIDIWTST